VALRAPAPVAPLGRRLAAFILDGFILVPVYVVYAVVLDALFGPLVEADPGGTGLIVVAVDPPRVALELALTLLTDAAYFAGSWARWGMTLGQRICGVAVRAVGPGPDRPPGDARGLPPHPDLVPAQAAVTRWAVLQLLPLCAATLGAAGAVPFGAVAALNAAWSGLLFVSVLADPLRRGLHDRAAATVVVRPDLPARR
jgi:uncharacterized RDD family membrane protein YckC